MKDTPEFARIDDLFRERYRGDPAIVVPDHGANSGFFDGVLHLLRLLQVSRERLITQNHLPRLGCGDRNFGMGIVWAGNVEDVDLGIVDELSPVGVVRLITPFVRKLFCLFRISRGNGLEHGLIFDIEKLADG